MAIPIAVWAATTTIDTAVVAAAGTAVGAATLPVAVVGAAALAGKAAIDAYFAADVSAQQAQLADLAATLNNPTTFAQEATPAVPDYPAFR